MILSVKKWCAERCNAGTRENIAEMTGLAIPQLGSRHPEAVRQSCLDGTVLFHQVHRPGPPGTTRTTSVPAVAELVTESLAPIDAARSRIPTSPQWPVGVASAGSNPRP